MQKTNFKNNLIENMFSLLFLKFISMCTAASHERTKRRLAPNGELEGVAPLPYVLFLAAPTHCTVHGGAAVAA